MREHKEVTERLLERRDKAKLRKKSPYYVRLIPAAACFLIIAVAVPSVLIISKRESPAGIENNTASIEETTEDKQNGQILYAWNDTRERNQKNTVISEAAILYPWEYLTDAEKYTYVKYNGNEYSTKAAEIAKNHLGEKLTSGKVKGYDNIGEKEYSRNCDIYEISGVNPKYLIAVSVNSEKTNFIVFSNSEFNPPATLGDFIKNYDLRNNISLTVFTDETKQLSFIPAECSADVWSLIYECEASSFDTTQTGLNTTAERYVSFIAYSETLGIKDLCFKITSDGFILTNICDYLYSFNIGSEAAGRLLALIEAQKKPVELIDIPIQNSTGPLYSAVSSDVTKWTVTGKVTEISDDYVKVDDSVIMKNPDEGIVFTFSRSDIRFSRAFSTGNVKVGDTVVVYLTSEILADAEGNPMAYEAYDVQKAIIFDGEIFIPE